MVTILKPGDVWRTFFSTWRLESDERLDLSFFFGAGFGCGAAMKITQGQKLALQTSYKRSAQLGGKISVSPAELSGTIGTEVAVSVAHEISATYEWSYAAKPCEYCVPKVHFPGSRIQVLTRLSMHLPFLSSRRTIFSPGETYEIRGGCAHAPERCGCTEPDKVQTQGGGSTAATADQVDSHLEHVLLAERGELPPVKALAQGLTDRQAGDTRDWRMYLVDLNGRPYSVKRCDQEHSLYSLDDTDRAIDAIRLRKGVNELLFVAHADGAGTENPGEMAVDLRSDLVDRPLIQGTISKFRSGPMSWVVVRLDCGQVGIAGTAAADDNLVLRAHEAGRTRQWPAVVIGT